jgi:hypothetical protein
MTKKKHLARIKLRDTAEALSLEIHEHKWDHLGEFPRKPIGKWKEIPRELERRCPGHSLEEYRDALARAMYP